jgi:hypothetical protein
MIFFSNPRLLVIAVGIAGASWTSPSASQSTVTIPLSGTLEPRCSARIHDLQVSPDQDLKITLFIDHGCNKGHTLLLRVRKGAGADLTRTRTTYAGKSPNHTTESDMSFRYSQPIERSGFMSITVPNATDAERDALLETLTVSVLSD